MTRDVAINKATLHTGFVFEYVVPLRAVHWPLIGVARAACLVRVAVLTWLSEIWMGLRMGEPEGLQSSGKGLGMAGSEDGRTWCSPWSRL